MDHAGESVPPFSPVPLNPVPFSDPVALRIMLDSAIRRRLPDMVEEVEGGGDFVCREGEVMLMSTLWGNGGGILCEAVRSSSLTSVGVCCSSCCSCFNCCRVSCSFVDEVLMSDSRLSLVLESLIQ